MVLYMCQHVARQSVVHPVTELFPITFSKQVQLLFCQKQKNIHFILVFLGTWGVRGGWGGGGCKWH